MWILLEKAIRQHFTQLKMKYSAIILKRTAGNIHYQISCESEIFLGILLLFSQLWPTDKGIWVILWAHLAFHVSHIFLINLFVTHFQIYLCVLVSVQHCRKMSPATFTLMILLHSNLLIVFRGGIKTYNLLMYNIFIKLQPCLPCKIHLYGIANEDQMRCS